MTGRIEFTDFSVHYDSGDVPVADVAVLEVPALDVPVLDVPVLAGLTLTIEPGQTVLVTGGSGCGKTTLLRCINGLIPGFIEARTSGELQVGGERVSDLEPRDLAHRVGMVFQDPRSEFFTHDVLSELAFPCENFGIDADEIRRRIQAVARQLDLGRLLHRRLAELSSGEKQKVAVAAALILRPGVLLFDEPSANLDHDGLTMLAETLAGLKRAGHTVVIADHRLNYLAGVIDRCLVLADGRVSADLTADELDALPPRWFEEQGLRQLSTATGPSGPAIAPTAGQGPRLLGTDYAHRGQPTLWTVDDLRLPDQGIIGITGPNGCGKTTLLKVIMGVHRRHGGRLRRGDRPWPPRRRLRECAYVMQDVDYQLMGETVWQEMLLGVRPDPDAEARATELLTRVDLWPLRDRHPLTLSGGQKQRLGIALAAMKDAPVVCLDEPTSGLDALSMRRVAALLTELAQDGTLVLVITHDREFADLTSEATIEISDRTVRLRTTPPLPSSKPALAKERP